MGCRTVGFPDQQHVASQSLEDPFDGNDGADQRDRHTWLVGDESIEDISEIRPVMGDHAVADQVGDAAVGTDGRQCPPGHERQTAIIESKADEVGADRLDASVAPPATDEQEFDRVLAFGQVGEQPEKAGGLLGTPS